MVGAFFLEVSLAGLAFSDAFPFDVGCGFYADRFGDRH